MVGNCSVCIVVCDDRLIVLIPVCFARGRVISHMNLVCHTYILNQLQFSTKTRRTAQDLTTRRRTLLLGVMIKYISLTVVSMFCITHSRQSVLYHSQSSVCSVSLTVFSMFCITHSHQSVLYHSQSSVCSVSLTVVSLFCITHSRQYVLYHSLSSICSVSLTVISITHSHPSHSQSSQSLTVLFFVQLIH